MTNQQTIAITVSGKYDANHYYYRYLRLDFNFSHHEALSYMMICHSVHTN